MNSKPGTLVLCERIYISGLPRLKHLNKFSHSLKLKLSPSNSSFRRPHVKEMWEKIDKGGSWVRSMSPFDRKLLDIRMAGVSSETLELLIEEGWFGNFSLSLLARIVAFNTHGDGNKQRHALSCMTCLRTLSLTCVAMFSAISVSEYLTGDDNTCPASDCKEQLGSNIVFSEASLRRRISDNLDASSSNSTYDDTSIVLQHEYSSSKIKAVLEVQSYCKWTSMLDLVEISLNQYCIQYRRLDGTLTLSSRVRTVKVFNTDPKVTVMLMSLKAGNLCLNMVAACHEFLLDLWWNPTTEDQAVDRAHRNAQIRPVTVT
uniref:Helicase C-terminal domain-containing protein n=2 Tax=Populus alba TaxID=43335 RepID=A0A4U5N8X7_POPAL|nr:hypothetical protein D5086_0000278540 [Populus alba]